MNTKILVTAIAVLAAGAAVSGVSAQEAMHHSMNMTHGKMTHGAKMAAYDAKESKAMHGAKI